MPSAIVTRANVPVEDRKLKVANIPIVQLSDYP